MIKITKVGGLTKIEQDTSIQYVRNAVSPKVFVSGENVTLRFLDKEDGIDVRVNTTLSNLEIAGSTPTDTEELDTQLALVFPNPGGDSGQTTPTAASVDITGLTTVALPAADIVNLTSANATETIDSMSGGTVNECYELRPEAGLTLTITFTASASAAAGAIVGPTADLVLNGSKGDFIKIVKRGAIYYQVDAMNYL